VRLRCVLCRWEGELSELPRRCPACGVEAEALKRAADVARVLEGPVCGPSSVPIRRPPLGVLARELEEQLALARSAHSVERKSRKSPPVRVPGQRP
jgi:hypothetical protein